jgi:hypothetical protein
MSFPSFVWSGASLGRAFLSQTAKLRRRRLIFARREPDALCFYLPVLLCLSFSCALRAHHLISCVPFPRLFNRQGLAWRMPLWAVKAVDAGQLKYSCHTVRTRSRRQTASFRLPSNYTHGELRRSTPNCPKQSMQSAPPAHDSASPRHRRSPASLSRVSSCEHTSPGMSRFVARQVDPTSCCFFYDPTSKSPNPGRALHENKASVIAW